MELDERKWRILRTIVDDYILTATPVGSRAISKRAEIALSSATIRNEMSDLEEMGYLDQPHTSAGRVPSNKAYRLYVDHMMQRAQMSANDVAMIRQQIGKHIDRVEDLIAQTAKVLSQLTNYPSVVIAPEMQSAAIKHIQLVPVTENRALAVVVTDAGTVHDMLMHVPHGFGMDELERYSRILTRRLAGHTAKDAIAALEGEFGDELSEHRAFFDQVADVIGSDIKKTSKRQIALGGAASIFMHPEFSDMETARTLLNVLETRDILFDLLERANTHGPLEITVTIGEENEISEMKGVSIVTATYRFGDQPIGSFGVIGPTRMDYARVTAVLECMGRSLSEIFTS